MKILCVTTSYPRHADDAAGSFVATRVHTLRAAGHQVVVIAAGDTAGRAPAGAAVEEDAIEVVRVPHRLAGLGLFYDGGAPELIDRAPGRAALLGAHFFAGLIRAIRARLAGVDAVESHWLLPSALAVIAAGARVPHRAQAHSGDVALLERLSVGDALARHLAAGDIAFHFASADLRARFAARLMGQPTGAAVPRGRAGDRREQDAIALAAARVLAAAVTPAESPLTLSPAVARTPAARELARRALGWPFDPKVVLAVGRLVPIKGYDQLVRAIGRLPPPRPVVVILGEGPERARLEALAQARAVDLRLPGQRPAAAVARHYAAADVFVHPARRLPGGRSEGTPLAVREALHAGLPVIASATGGIPELRSSNANLVVLQPGETGVELAALEQAVARATGVAEDGAEAQKP